MKRLHVAPQQVTQEMKRSICHRIHCVKRREREPLQISTLAALPELIETGRSELLRLAIPQAEVKFQRQWNIRIEKIAPPFPAGFTDHRGQMIHTAVRFPQRLIAEATRDVTGAQQVLLRQEQVD